MLHGFKKDERGFSLVEGLLIIIALALVVFVGYYVWHNQKNTKASNTSANAVQSNKKSTTTSQKYVTIKEWGVKAPYSGNLNLDYTISSDKKEASFTSTELVGLDSTCEPAYGGGIQRFAPNEDAAEGPGGGLTAAQRAEQADKGTYAFINGYYYFFVHAQSACPGATSSAAQEFALQSQTNEDVKALVGKLQAE